MDFFKKITDNFIMGRAWFECFFNEIASQLDLTDTEANTIINSYESVGKYLNNSSNLFSLKPSIFPQGSFSIGTVVKPLKKDDYDIDLVCELGNARDFSPEQVKRIVGDSLKSGRYCSQLEEEHGRCWTLAFKASPPYHLDILAGVPYENNKIKATIKRDGSNSYSWLITNPKGFSNWFISLYKHKRIFDESRKVEKVNIYKNKNPLQRAIQLIKRHRDVYFESNPDLGPASVIITALTGLCYHGETSIEDILKFCVLPWASKIKIIGGKYYINVSDDVDDNYADKWNGEDLSASKNFFEWHRKLVLDLDILLAQTTEEGFIKKSKEMFKESVVDKILNENVQISSLLHDSFGNNQVLRLEDTHPLFSHAFSISNHAGFIPRPSARINIDGKVFNSKEDSRKNINCVYCFDTHSMLLEKNKYLRFIAHINTKNSYILWQITNTGQDALDHGKECLRGNFEKSDLNDQIKYECTFYSGTHFVQAFLIDCNSNRCIAKSNILTVNICGDKNEI